MRKLVDQEQKHLEGVREFRKQLVVELQLLRDISIVWVNGSVAELLHHLQELGLELERRSSDRSQVPLDREPGHHVGTRRFCRVRRGDPRGPTPTASTALGVAGDRPDHPPAIYCQDISKNLVSPSALLK